MLRYILGRLVSLSLSLIVASLVIFTVIEVIPGDPAAFMLGLNADEATVQALRAELGIDGSTGIDDDHDMVLCVSLKHQCTTMSCCQHIWTRACSMVPEAALWNAQLLPSVLIDNVTEAWQD